MDAHPQRETPGLVGLVGLGLMGTALAERLLDHGFRVAVWNRTRAKADPLLARGAEWTDDPFARCPRVLISLYSSDVVEEVLDRFADSLRPGHLLVDTTTGDPNRTVALAARLKSRAVRYLEAPISGSSEQTRRGEATVLVGADPADFQAGADLWPILGRRVFHVGPCGGASKMKLVSNLVLGLNRAALAEGLAFAEAIGVPAAAALEVLAGSNAYSRAMDAKGRKMIERDYTPQARLSQHLKDVRLMLAAATDAGLPLPLTETHRRLMEQAETAGLGDLDNSAILEVLRRPATPAAP
jgi:3-hydroxyisobutyrate dehydrogenase-like beta-hydroxyacid dehydrogenase